MPKLAFELTDLQVRRLRWGKASTGPNKGKPCTKVFAVGGVAGLTLQCSPPAREDANFARSWVLKVSVAGKRSEIGLGPYPEVTLGMARERARAIRAKIREGVDPLSERREALSQLIKDRAKSKTFLDVGTAYEAKKAREYKTTKQAKKLASQLNTYVYPFIGNMVVGDIQRANIVQLLTPQWETKTETMTRIRAVVENILDMAGAEGLRAGDNPARWKGNLELSLPSPNKLTKVKHFKAMAVDDLPAFMSALSQKTTTGANALRFGVLTAARSGEIRGATWEEIDLNEKLWTIPGDRMKNGREHKVPLCPAVIKLVKSLDADGDLLFTAPRGGMLSDMTLTKVLKDMGHKVTQHGFRATFRTWAQDHTNYPEEVCELALAHVNSDRTRAAYARSQLVDKRRRLMQQWQVFCDADRSKSKSVVSIRGGA